MNAILDLISALLNAVINLLRKILKKLTRIEYAANQIVRLMAKAAEQSGEVAGQLPSQTLDESDPLYGAKYAADRIGVVDRTLYRLTATGMLPIHSYIRGIRHFRHSDIERCRRYYRGE